MTCCCVACQRPHRLGIDLCQYTPQGALLRGREVIGRTQSGFCDRSELEKPRVALMLKTLAGLLP